nr:hypothetical protein [uncultured Cohaesibacter sp.]
MAKIVHPVAGAVALVMILTFWLSTTLSELFANQSVVTMVKTAIPWGFLILVPAMMIVGASGFRLGKTWRGPLVAKKRARMPLIAANGLLVLIPAALYLSSKAQSGAFDTEFYAVQVLELVAGALNITLLTLNMCDGLRLKGRLPSDPNH